MLEDFLQERAALYVTGTMTADERAEFEPLLEFHPELRRHVAGLQEAMTTVALAQAGSAARPPAALKARLLAALDALPPAPPPEAVVVTDPAGRVEWVNPAFTALCGYTLNELRGRKPGHLLQGRDTDQAAVARLREAVRAAQACRETLINYHRDGTPYHVDIRITPVLDEAQRPRWLLARERKLAVAPA